MSFISQNKTIAALNGFVEHHTGGGCMVFSKALSHYWDIWISADGSYINTDPASHDWIIGIYHREGHDSFGSWEGFSLCGAMARVDNLPVPKTGMGHVVVDTYAEFLNQIRGA